MGCAVWLRGVGARGGERAMLSIERVRQNLSLADIWLNAVHYAKEVIICGVP